MGEEGLTDHAPLSADAHKKKRRIAFSVAEKAMLVKRSRMAPRPSQKELQSWFKDTCGKDIAQGTLYGILKESDKWLHHEETALSARDKQKKKQRSYNVEELEELLYTWFLHMEAKRAPLTDLPL